MAVNRTRIGGLVIGVNVLLVAIWWLLPLWMYGVFDDGMFYGSISRNLIYDAQATIWDLKVSNALDPQFNGHPPLGFWLQACFFWLFGDVYWIERVYSLFLALWGIGLLVACWRLFEKNGARLALFFWLSISIVGWSFGNNLLENLLTICTTTAVYFLVLAAQSARKSWWWVFLGGLFIGAALLTKGPVGLYPLAVPLGYAFFIEKTHWKRAFGETLFLLVLLITAYWMLTTLSPRAAVFFERYWELQLLGSLTGQDSLAAHRFYVVQALLEEALPPLLLGVGIQLLARYFKLIKQPINKKVVLFWLFIAVSASLPLLVSPKQLRFYIVPSMGWYALSWGMFCWPAFLALVEHTKTWKYTQLVLNSLVVLGVGACVVMSVLNRGKNAREVELLGDTRAIGALAAPHSTISITNVLYNKWNLHAYFYRYYYIDLTTTYIEPKYVVTAKGEVYERPAYKKKEIGLTTLELYERQY